MLQATSVAMRLTREIEPASLDDWVAGCDRALARGARMLTLFGREDGTGRVVTTAVLLPEHGSIEILRGHGVPNQRYQALTSNHPAVHMFERELWEQTGLVPEGHPWLKPVRYEGARQQQMHGHPYFNVRGHGIHEVGVGPIHASVIEPGHFRFMCHGETVHHLEIQLGYQHRGVEALLLRRNPLGLAPLVETIVGDSSIAYAWGYCAAVEALSDTQVNLQTDIVRGIALELERIGMHLVALTGLATDIAFLQGGATYGRLRTAIINATMRACGSRFGRGWLRPGDARFGIDDARRADLVQTIAGLLKDMAEVNDLMLGARSVKARFQGVGTVDAQSARGIGLTGLVARASGLPFDTRSRLPGKLYTAHPVPTLVEDTGDCWARFRLRMREAEASARWIAKALQVPDLALPPHQAAAPGRLWPRTLCVSVREGFRGPVIQALETGEDGSLLHYKVQDPSMQNWYGLALALRENEISDFPICNKSFDLSYCGNDL
ncbi:NADH-quinone oxidoreductase subunit C [Ramlibacter sp. WS9]|uniref:hydrogenase large subunit n=1 Tax=Ramlibacter sp. WS9 TaxID=1882741 RepID=UPI001143E94D|nr:NADH-quinone oxidoreductase subunit C [Ramlibacter sp. WS9]ROZ78359.1 hydrogenase [Ramlibacter sp. WS9]